MTDGPEDAELSLQEAAHRGLLPVIRQRLAEGADIEGINTDGRTALHEAVLEGHVDALKLLMHAGANIDTPLASSSMTALHVACYTINCAMVAQVLSHGPSLEARADGLTPLLAAVSTGDAEIVRLLLDAGAEVAAPSLGHVGSGESALHIAVAYYKPLLLPLLLQHGADVDAASRSAPGRTALHVAAQYGNVEAVGILIAAGARVSARDADGATALHLAAYNGHAKSANVLLQHGAEVSATDQSGEVPLYLAAVQGECSMASLLLDNGAGNIPEPTRIRIAMSAAASARLEVVQLLEQAGFDILGHDEAGETCLTVASFHGHKDMVVYLLKRGADPGHRSSFGTSAIGMARGSGHDNVVTLIQQAEDQRKADPRAELFPDWRYAGGGDQPSQADLMAGLLSVVETRRIRHNQELAGALRCEICKDLDFRRGMAPEEHVVYFMARGSMASGASRGCNGCQFILDCISTIQEAYGPSVLEREPSDGAGSPVVLHSTGDGAPLLIQTSDLRSTSGKRIEVYVDKGTQMGHPFGSVKVSW